jgi:lysine-N-methylase
MNTTSTIQPTYAAAFRCIGDRCEDACCSHWDIPLDRKTYEQYKLFPREKLGTTVSELVSIRSANAPDGLYAWIGRRPSGHCAFFGDDRLCNIQREYGQQMLSATCSIYPRSLSLVGDQLEGSLSLSCPEAARNVLFDPDLMQTRGDLRAGGFRTDNVYRLASDQNGSPGKPHEAFLAIRQWMIGTLRDRSRPLWHRLMDIGAMCQRLEDHTIALKPVDWETMPSRPGWKLDVVFELAGALMSDATGSRFREAFRTFVDGVGSMDPGMPGDYLDGFSQVAGRYHRSFFNSHPYVLENFVINYIFQHLFPYGRVVDAKLPSRGIFDQFLLLATQFAWIDTMLVGIAGHHRGAFAAEHVVHAVQSFTREFEHEPGATEGLLGVVKQRQMDNLEGMAILVRR